MPPSLATSQYPGGPMGSMEISSVAWLERKFESVTLKVTVYCPEIVGVPLRTPVGATWIPGGRAPPCDRPSVRGQPAAGRQRGFVRHADGPDREAGGGDVGRRREGGDGAAEVRSRPDGFAVDRAGAHDPGQGRDSGWSALAVHPAPPLVVAMMLSPPTAVQIDVLMQLTDSRVVDPMGVPRSVQVEPAVGRADEMRAGGQAGRDAGARNAREGCCRRRSRLRHPGVSTVGRGEDDGVRAARRNPNRSAVKGVGARDACEVGHDAGVGLRRPRRPAVGRRDDAGCEVLDVAHGVADRGVAHETPVEMPTEEGTVSEDQVAPALTVPMMTGLPKMPKPTAVQSDDVMHEMPFRPATPEGSDCGLQARPALTDARTESTPTAKQSAVVGHETELRRLVPGGGLCAVHDKSARRRGHDGGPGPKVARVADGDAVLGGRAGDPGEFDGVARRGLERPGVAIVGCLDHIWGRAEVGTDGDTCCCAWDR